ncbi:MAG: hypothetical protein II961_03220 [Candidatus Riflebacteria bacterium]|nr:hypothetical protein [Candidatus Riflebacteria bacterium]
MNNENEVEKTENIEKIDAIKRKSQPKDLFESFESSIDWNLVSIFSIWIFLFLTFFCIFVKN